MDNTDRTNLRCPWCAYTLSEQELQVGLCDGCGKEINTTRLIARKNDLTKQEVDDRRAILAERLGAFLGVFMIAAGITGVCFSQVGPAQLLSEWGIAFILTTIVVIIYRRIDESPLHPVLLAFGFIWLLWGIFLCNVL